MEGQVWGHCADVGSLCRCGLIVQVWGHCAGVRSLCRCEVTVQMWGHCSGICLKLPNPTPDMLVLCASAHRREASVPAPLSSMLLQDQILVCSPRDRARGLRNRASHRVCVEPSTK
jgi:hypothetical protein